MMKTGQVEKTSDRQYEVEERRYRTLESASLRLQKEAKGYLDSLRAMTASQMRIAETIDAFYGDSGATDGVSRSYKQAVEDLDAETVKALDGPYRCVPSDLRRYAWDSDEGIEDKKELRAIEWEMNQGGRQNFAGVLRADMDAYGELMDFVYRTTVLEPINRFCAYFPDINECEWILCCEGDRRGRDTDKVYRYQEAEPQDARLRLDALESQATHREARQGPGQAASHRERTGYGQPLRFPS
jgi:hypothetical protein